MYQAMHAETCHVYLEHVSQPNARCFYKPTNSCIRWLPHNNGKFCSAHNHVVSLQVLPICIPMNLSFPAQQCTQTLHSNQLVLDVAVLNSTLSPPCPPPEALATQCCAV